MKKDSVQTSRKLKEQLVTFPSVMHPHFRALSMGISTLALFFGCGLAFHPQEISFLRSLKLNVLKIFRKLHFDCLRVCRKLGFYQLVPCVWHHLPCETFVYVTVSPKQQQMNGSSTKLRMKKLGFFKKCISKFKKKKKPHTYGQGLGFNLSFIWPRFP